MKEKAKKQAASFEEAMERLESIVSSMEEGDIPLDALLAKYEEGTEMLKIAENHLKSAELKIEQLKNQSGDASLSPFELEDSE